MSISILDPNKWSTDLMEQAKTQLVSALPQLQGAEQAVLEGGIKTFLAGMLPTIQAMAQAGEQTALNSLADRETQGLDWVTATLLPALDKMLDAKIDRLMKARVTVGFEEPKA